MTRIRVLWLSAFVKDVRIPETEAEMGRECLGLQVGGGEGQAERLHALLWIVSDLLRLNSQQL